MPASSGDLLFQLRSIPPFRDKRGRFQAAEAALNRERQAVIASEARRFLRYAREEAPGRRYPRQLDVATFMQGTHLGFHLTGPEPLSTFILKGTRPHRIAPRRARALRFFWPRIGAAAVVPRQAGFRTHFRGGVLWIGKGYVNHPGTRPNRFVGRAFRRWLPGARKVLRRLSDAFVREFTTTGGSRRFP